MEELRASCRRTWRSPDQLIEGRQSIPDEPTLPDSDSGCDADADSAVSAQTNPLPVMRVRTPIAPWFSDRTDSPLLALQPSALRTTTSSLERIGGIRPATATEQKIWGIAQERFELIQFLLSIASGLCICGVFLCVVGNITMITVVALTAILHYFGKPTPEVSEAPRRVSFSGETTGLLATGAEEECPWDASSSIRIFSMLTPALLSKVTSGRKKSSLGHSLKRVAEILSAVITLNPSHTWDSSDRPSLGHNLRCRFPVHGDTLQPLKMGPLAILPPLSEKGFELFFSFDFQEKTGVLTLQPSALSYAGSALSLYYFLAINDRARSSYCVEKVEFDTTKKEIHFYGKERLFSGASSPDTESWAKVSPPPLPVSPLPLPDDQASDNGDDVIVEAGLLFTVSFEQVRYRISGLLLGIGERP